MAAKGWAILLEGGRIPWEKKGKSIPDHNLHGMRSNCLIDLFFFLHTKQLSVFRVNGTLIRSPCVSTLHTWDLEAAWAGGQVHLTMGGWILSKMRSSSSQYRHTSEFSHTVVAPTQSCTTADLAVELNSCSSVLGGASPSGTAISPVLRLSL